MTNQELYKQAILDAKAVRETALAAAKESLSEAFEPRIKEMMRIKLSEELEEGNDLEESEENMEESMKMADESGMEEAKNDMMDESYLDEILAELDSISEELEEADDLEEGHNKADGYVGTKGKGGMGYDEKAKTSKGDHKLHEAEEDEEEVEDEEAPEGDESDMDAGASAGGDEGPVSDDEAVVDIKVGELKDIFRTVFAQLQGGGAPAMGAEPATDEENSMMSAGGPEEMEEISLEEILAELEKENQMEENLNPGAEATHKSRPGSYGAGQASIEEKKKMEEKKMAKMEKDLEEATKAVKAMKEELNEINLLNAKLLYFNKILKSKSLQESQKVKVMNAFDRATNVKEVENTYKTLSESLAAPKKATLKESIGFASKPIGNAPAKPIVETDAFVSRWQVLAGIK